MVGEWGADWVYRYDDENNVHFDKFRYVEGNQEHEFIPNSDMAYSDFLRAIRKEWDARGKNWGEP